jgi:2'-5' RNA ligase
VRLFVAVTPPEEVLAVVTGLERPNLEKLRWTTQEQWHVTLRFLGEVESAAPVARSLGEAASRFRETGAEVEATLGPAIAWFTGRRILQVPVGGLDDLARVVVEATALHGEPPDPHPFVGHLTLARVRGQGKGPSNLAGSPVRASWKVQEVSLFSSTLGRGGAVYETVERFPVSA